MNSIVRCLSCSSFYLIPFNDFNLYDEEIVPIFEDEAEAEKDDNDEYDDSNFQNLFDILSNF